LRRDGSVFKLYRRVSHFQVKSRIIGWITIDVYSEQKKIVKRIECSGFLVSRGDGSDVGDP